MRNKSSDFAEVSAEQDILTFDEVCDVLTGIWYSESLIKRLVATANLYCKDLGLHNLDGEDVLNHVAANLLTPGIYLWPRQMAEKPEAFILLSAWRYCFDQKRTKKGNWDRASGSESTLLELADPKSPEIIVESRDWISKLYAALSHDPLAQEVMLLKYAQGMEHAEIEQLFALPPNRVKAAVKTIQRMQQKMVAEVKKS